MFLHLAVVLVTESNLPAPKNVVVVAMANKLARIAWAVLSSGEDYRPNSSMITAS
jgi:hypothetical protein